MANVYNYDFFQIPHTGVEEPDLESARSDANATLRQPFKMRLSNFGALNVGKRKSYDYTGTVLDFKFKDEMSDIVTTKSGIRDADVTDEVTVIFNPYVEGSTVKFVRDDQFIRMLMSTSCGYDLALPKYDVMDTKEATASGIVTISGGLYLHWPSEGWHSFGGRYDFE